MNQYSYLHQSLTFSPISLANSKTIEGLECLQNKWDIRTGIGIDRFRFNSCHNSSA